MGPGDENNDRNKGEPDQGSAGGQAGREGGALFTRLPGDASAEPQCQGDGIQGCWYVTLNQARLNGLRTNDQVQFTDQDAAFVIEKAESFDESRSSHFFRDVKTFQETLVRVGS